MANASSNAPSNRSRFDQFAQKATHVVTRPWFFWLIVVALLAWVPTLWLWKTGASDLLVDSLTNPLSLILLVLLQNSQSRQQDAMSRRLDTLERSLATLLQHLGKDTSDSGRRDELIKAAQSLIDDARKSSEESTAGQQTSRGE